MTSDSEVPATPATEEAQPEPNPWQLRSDDLRATRIMFGLLSSCTTVNNHMVSDSWDGTMHKGDYNMGLPVGQLHGTCTSTFTERKDNCVREDGRKHSAVAQWGTNSRKIIEDVWMAHSREVIETRFPGFKWAARVLRMHES